MNGGKRGDNKERRDILSLTVSCGVKSKAGQRGGRVVSTPSSQQQGPGMGKMAFLCPDFSFSPCLRWFPPGAPVSTPTKNMFLEKPSSPFQILPD